MDRKTFVSSLFSVPDHVHRSERIVASGITPYAGTWGHDQVVHLLRRTGFGAPQNLVTQLSGLTMNAAVNLVLTPLGAAPAPPLNYYTNPADADGIAYGATWVNKEPTLNLVTLNPPRVDSYRAWWIDRMLTSGPSIHEKMVLFWHNHFATSSNNMFAAWMYKHNTVLRQYAMGNVKDFAKAITKDPCMLQFLNGNLNSAAAPDENYGRELQELFTVGKGPGSGYTEDDVKAAAKVLTGYRINYLTASGYYFDATKHDTNSKQFSAFYNNTVISGQSGAAGENELDAMLNMIFSVDETAKHIVRRLYMFFVYYNIDAAVETNVIEPLANILVSNNYDILPVLAALFKSEHFFDPANMSCYIKSPIDQVLGLVRELEVQLPADPAMKKEAQLRLYAYAANMGMAIHDIPQVAGWAAYYQTPAFHENWINSSTLAFRIDYAKALLNGINYGGATPLKPDLKAYVSTFTNPSDPNALVQEACERLYRFPISQTGRDFLKGFLLSGGFGNDSYWVMAWDDYVQNPSDPGAINTVETRLKALFETMFSQSEIQIA